MKLSKEYIREKLIGLGFVLNDQTVKVDKSEIYKYNKEILFFIVFYYYFSMFILTNYYSEIDYFFTDLINSILF